MGPGLSFQLIQVRVLTWHDLNLLDEGTMSHIRRRQLLIAAAACAASPFAHSREELRRIGCLFGGSPTTHRRALDAFRTGLAESGWIEGRNVAIEVRWAEGRMERIPALAAELVALNPHVILTAANPVIAEVKKATQSIPIVMATGADPVESGFVASLARPGGNLTGLTGFYESTPFKMFELASALVPRGAHVAVMLERNTVFARERYRNQLADAAQKLGLQTQILDVSKRDDVDRVFAAQANSRPAALIVLPGPMIFALGSDLVNRAESLAIPVIYPFEEMTEAGGLMSYAPDLLDSYRRAARYVDRILKGAKAGDMAIEQPTRLLLAINMRAAKAQGIRIPQSILQRADRIIE
jgi:putative tryptophan/tyrosine transport system substrate-binding protein